MIRFTSFFVLLALSISMILIVSCSEDESEQSPQENQKPAPVLPPTFDILIPETDLSIPSIYAKIRIEFLKATILPAFEAISSMENEKPKFAPFQEEPDTFYWEVKIRDFTAYLYAGYSDDLSRFGWYLVFDGPGLFVDYDNWVVAEGEFAVDGTEGNYVFYKLNSDEKAIDCVRETDDEGYTLNYNNYIFGYEAIYRLNNDGSGYYREYLNGVLRFEFTWDGQGGGSWAIYDKDGNLVRSGEWGEA